MGRGWVASLEGKQCPICGIHRYVDRQSKHLIGRKRLWIGLNVGPKMEQEMKRKGNDLQSNRRILIGAEDFEMQGRRA